jgi:hypothetical protein
MTAIISRDHSDATGRRRREDSLAAELAARGVDVIVTPHLYHVAENAPLWAELAALDRPLTVFLWMHPRPAKWVLRKHSVGADGLRVVDLGAADDTDVRDLAEQANPAPAGGSEKTTGAAGAADRSGHARGSIRETDAPTATRWYPVLDYDRCIACRQCLQFCLFGVYREKDGGVAATQPDRCKAGCPACSRICPSGAIMFPLYEADPAVAGAPGTTMQPDAAARKMYQERVGTAHAERAGFATSGGDRSDHAAGDDLDELLDDLDRLTG